MASYSVVANSSNECKDEDALNNSLRTCANEPDFAVICAFLQKFSKDLGIDGPNFKLLQEWLTNTDEVSDTLRDLHIKLLRKTRRTVHEKSWESALSKFCFSYSLQDAWEIERFGYKKASLKVKLRVLRELLESQFERNAKFRAKILQLSADSLRSEPIGRDRHGHAYWLTQDKDCNLRIYQEHLDEEIWQVVATNREEFVNLITRLRGNEVVLPSTDIGAADEDSSSNSCNATLEKPPPPEEKDDSQEANMDIKVPNLKITLNTMGGENTIEEVVERVKDKNAPEEVVESSAGERKVKPLIIMQTKVASASPTNSCSSGNAKKRNADELDRSSPIEMHHAKTKSRPLLMDSKRAKNQSKYARAASEDEDDDDEDEDGDDEEEDDDDEEDDVDDEGEDDEEEIGEEECEEEDIDSAAADTCEQEEKEVEENDDNENNATIVGPAIEDPPVIVHGSGAGKDCESSIKDVQSVDAFHCFSFEMTEDEDDNPIDGEEIVEDKQYVLGFGEGALSMVGNKKTEDSETEEPKAKFFFGEPGCLKLSPLKATSTPESSIPKPQKEKEVNTENENNELAKIADDDDEEEGAELSKVNDLAPKQIDKPKEKKKQETVVNDSEIQYKKEEEEENKLCEKSSELAKKIANRKESSDHEDDELKIQENSNQNDNAANSVKDEELTKSNEEENTEELEHDEQNKRKATQLGVRGDGKTEKMGKEVESINQICKKYIKSQSENNLELSENNGIKKVESLEEDVEGIENSNSREKSSKESKEDNLSKATAVLEDDHKSDRLMEKSANANEKTGKGPQKERNTELNKDPLTSCSSKTEISKSSTKNLPNRKRRLSDFTKDTAPRSNSESELDLNSDQQVAGDCSEELQQENVGGKRLKMRQKLSNLEIRRKVEAKKALKDETASSSGEEDSHRRRNCSEAKMVGGRESERNADVCANSITTVQTVVIDAKTMSPGILQNEPKSIQMKKDDKNVEPQTFSTKNKLPITKPLKKNLLTKVRSAEIDAEKHVPPTNPESVMSGVHKSEKDAESVLPIEESEGAKEISKEEDHLKKCKINREKRKSIDSEPQIKECKIEKTETNANDDLENVKIENETETEKKPATDGDKHDMEKNDIGTSSDFKKEQNDFKTEKDTSNACEVNERKAIAGQLKRRSSEEHNEKDEPEVESADLLTKSTKKKAIDSPAECIETTNKIEVSPQNVKATNVSTKRQTTPPPVEPIVEPIGRRSGRRNASLVVYAELPQPKRTRAGTANNSNQPSSGTTKSTNKNVTTTQTEKSSSITSPTVVSKATSAKTTSEAQTKTPLVKTKPESTTTETLSSTKSVKQTKTVKNTKTPTADKKETDDKATKATPSRVVSGARKKLEVDTTNIIELNDSETPVRQSRRIAQQKIREEAERRKLEEIALRTMKQELKKKKIAEKEVDPTVTLPSEDSSSSSLASSATDATAVEQKKKSKKKQPGKDGSWSSGSEEQEDPEEEDEEPHHYSDPGSPLFKSDHEFSPESDLEDESQVVPMKRARTARKEDADASEQVGDEEENCQKCGKSDHPEWILLCDKCDKGYHCSCLSPVLFYIPEGDWYCPPCQQDQLIITLEKQLTEFDALVARKIIEDEEEKRRQEKEAEKAAKEEQERLENEKMKKDRKKSRKGKSRRNSSDNDENDHENDNSNKYAGESSDDSEVLSKVGGKKKRQSEESGAASEDSTKNFGKTRDKNKTSTRSKKSSHKDKSSKRSRGDGRSRRKAAKRCDRQRRRIDSDHSSSSGSSSNSGSDSDSSSSVSSTDSDDEPIYKLRKRRQINVSYRLNEYDDLINSALKKEMDEVAGAGNLGRGKDISTIIDADKDEKTEKKDCDDDDGGDGDVGESEKEAEKSKWKSGKNEDKDDKDDEPITKRKMKSGSSLKKKSRKLTTLDISSEEDDGSDEDFKTSSVEDDEEDTSVSVSSNSDSSLEVYRSRNKGGKKSHRKAARRAARERRKQSKFVVDDSFDDEDDKPLKQRSKKKKKSDSDFTETDVDDDELSELSENLNSSDLCDDSSSEQSDGAWHPSKRQKKRKSNAAKPSQKIETEKKTQRKKLKRLEYSDDDLSESDEETDEEGDDIAVSGKGKGSGKQPRSQPIKPGTKPKIKPKTMPTGSKHFSDEDPDSLPESADSDDSTRRTRGKRYAYIEDYEDDSSDGGIKPGVKRPDTPPEERQKFIEKQEEIKRMLAAKNAEGAKIAATPRLTPIKGGAASNEKQNSSSAKTGAGDALSAVPLSVIRQAKVLDIDYLQRKGEPLDNVLENVDDVDSEFDDTDLPDDLPEDMDEDTIARMVEEEEELNAVVGGGGSRDLSGSDKKVKEPEKIPSTVFVRNPASHSSHMTTQQTSQIHASAPAPAHPAGPSSNYGLQEPLRKRFPMPTIHPPLLRHQYHHPPDYINPNQLMHRAQSQAAPPMHLLQSALSMPIGQPLRGNFPSQQNRMPNMGTPPPRNVAPILRPGQTPSQQLSPSVSHHQRLPAAAAAEQNAESVSESKPRGRRKKITPLRDPMQKQQAAAAVAAAASASSLDKKTAEAIKTKQQQQQPDAVPTTSPLNIAQPPQLFTSTTVSGAENQPSVITRMPLMPRAPNDMPPGYYNPSLVTGPRIVRPPGSLAGMAPHGSMRPTYGPPPLHASIGPNVPGGGPPTNLSRPHIPPGQPVSGMYVRSAVPPPARHSTSHLNPYRPHIYGNPNYPRGAPNQTGTAGNIRAGPSVDYGGYSPYGPYYPPAPHQPLAAPPHHEPQSATQTQQQQPLTSSLPSTAQASSVIVTAPHTVNLVPTPPTVPPPNTVPTNHSVSAITRTVSPANPREEQLSSTKPAACTTTPPVPMPVVVHPNSNKTEIRKNLTTLETYSTDIVAKRVKSPMQIVAAGESSNSASRGSPVTAGPDIAEDSSSALGPSLTPAAAVTTSETPASEFSGLVSYFSSQHDDYNS